MRTSQQEREATLSNNATRILSALVSNSNVVGLFNPSAVIDKVTIPKSLIELSVTTAIELEKILQEKLTNG